MERVKKLTSMLPGCRHKGLYMAFSDIDRHKIKKAVGGLCNQRTPAHLKDQLRYEYEIEKQNVVIYEIRPAFMAEGEFTNMPVARLTYVSSRKVWKL